MSDFPERITQQQLELYLDEQLSGEAKSEFEKRLKDDPDAMRVVEAQRSVDARLRAAFSRPSATCEQIERLIEVKSPREEPTNAANNKSNRRAWLLTAAALAASVVWAFVMWQWGDRHELRPFFEPRPLTAIYRETVRQGFRPYYFCEDEERFAMTFAKRQKTPLQLAEMPDDRRMIGLSYSGGLSRDTTAMLCYFQDQPVVVFIDRGEVDNESLAMANSDSGLHVHRKELGGLVIYEISPLNQAKFAEFLELRERVAATGRVRVMLCDLLYAPWDCPSWSAAWHLFRPVASQHCRFDFGKQNRFRKKP